MKKNILSITIAGIWITISEFARNEFRDYRAMNIVFFIIGLLTFVLFILSENKTVGFLKFTGLFQRVNLIVLYGALILNYQKIIGHG